MKPQQPPVEHSAQFSRRNLFPSEDSDPDFTSITPLNFDSDEPETHPLDTETVGDYDILGPLEKNTTIHTPNNTQFVSISDKIQTPNTTNESPTQKLKTPHDSCACDNSKFPKLIRKNHQTDNSNLIDQCVNPKVRKGLFPETDMSLPSRTFYPKEQSEVSPRNFSVSKNLNLIKGRKKQRLYLCNRRSKFRSGQINAGVRHRIKKPKKKKISKLAALEAAINIIENSPLNAFLNESPQSEPEQLLAPSQQQQQQQQQSLPSPVPRDITPSPEPDPSKKFFKSSRHKGIVSINSNIKIEMSNGKMSLMAGNTKRRVLKRRQNHEDTPENISKRQKLVSDFETEPNLEQSLIADDISNIINTLEKEKENETTMTIVDPLALMSPTSQMCNMTSGLALNSPKKARDLSAVLEAMPSNNNDSQKKLFPIFYQKNHVSNNNNSYNKIEKNNSNPMKKFKGLSKDQMLLDAGQKRFGATQCPECKTIYHMGDPGDEIMHLNYHNAGHIFRYNGWKNERVVSNEFLDGKIVHVAPGDSKLWWKKVKDVMEVINRDLGFYDIEFNTTNSQIFFYVKSRVIVGALVAESKSIAHKLLTTHEDQVDLCSEEGYPIKCGVSRIWVAKNHRRSGIARSLMNSLKRNFMLGYVLRNEDIAFSSPTEMGKIFGQNYFKTPNFLIYFV